MNIIRFWMSVIVVAASAACLLIGVPTLMNMHNDGALVFAAIAFMFALTAPYVWFQRVLPKLSNLGD